MPLHGSWVNRRAGTPGLAHSGVAAIKAPPSDVQYALLSPTQTVLFLLDLKLGNEATNVIGHASPHSRHVLLVAPGPPHKDIMEPAGKGTHPSQLPFHRRLTLIGPMALLPVTAGAVFTGRVRRREIAVSQWATRPARHFPGDVM